MPYLVSCSGGIRAGAYSEDRGSVTGNMTRVFAKPGEPKLTDFVTFEHGQVRYNRRQWAIFTTATFQRQTPYRFTRAPMWIKYNERTGLLTISIIGENRKQWTLNNHPNVEVTIADDRSTLNLKFTGDVEANREGGHYNWMKDSWLRATR